MKIIISWVFLLVTFQISAQGIALIPFPNSISISNGHFHISDDVRIISTIEEYNSARQLQEYVKADAGLNLEIYLVEDLGAEEKDAILFVKNSERLEPYEYELIVNHNQIWIYYGSSQSAFYAIQSLRQLLFFNQENYNIPELSIVDRPQFSHRGLLLDCCRHFFSVDKVKEYIDLLAFYKMNVLHWHLTEDQGWRIEIDKYPELTNVGAWRTEDDGSVYGGFYTKEEIREIVKYAEERYITVIPEIELPGHSQAAIASYPWLSCTGEQYEVANNWGVFKEIYCAGNDSVFTFLEDVLTEVIDLFPSDYIHIGGDEAPKYRWENCEKCQSRIEEEGLSDEHELQSYFITRIEKFLNSKGKKLIGWDEILEGGLSPNATVQSWRGVENGIKAAKLKHKVIMSPTSHCYLDYGLDAIDLEKVYSFNPVPDELVGEYEEYVLGGEVNMWTERVPNDSVLDSKVFPRLIAAAEVFWSGANRNFDHFYDRLQEHYHILDSMGVNYGLETVLFRLNPIVQNDSVLVEIIPGNRHFALEYSYCKSDEKESYTEPIYVNCTDTIWVRILKNGEPLIDYDFPVPVNNHLALGKQPDYTNKFSKHYTAGGIYGLTDGLTGYLNFRDGRWQGFSGDDLEVVIDLEETQELQKLSFNYYLFPDAWIMQPKSVEVYGSMDNEKWKRIGGENEFVQTEDGSSQAVCTIPVELTGKKSYRYLKVVIENYGQLPDSHAAAGSDAWLFVDEIIVE